jgi:hypothetical protein
VSMTVALGLIPPYCGGGEAIPFTRFQKDNRKTVFCAINREADVERVYSFFLDSLQFGCLGQFFCQREEDTRLVHLRQIFVADRIEEKTYLTVICKLENEQAFPLGVSKCRVLYDRRYVMLHSSEELDDQIVGGGKGLREKFGEIKRVFDRMLTIPAEKDGCDINNVWEVYVQGSAGKNFCLTLQTLEIVEELTRAKMAELRSVFILRYNNERTQRNISDWPLSSLRQAFLALFFYGD